jgi:hypothetical protein
MRIRVRVRLRNPLEVSLFELLTRGLGHGQLHTQLIVQEMTGISPSSMMTTGNRPSSSSDSTTTTTVM